MKPTTTLFALALASAAAFGQTNPKRKFQPLHIPPEISGTDFKLRLHSASKSFWTGATTMTYAYNDETFWGPTLIWNKGDDVRIDVKNELDEPTTTHWHGLHIPAKMDGGPHQLIAAGKTWSPSFKVMNNAGTYWYHPHAHETTQKQLTYGAGGLIIIRDPEEAKLALPRTYGVDDLPLALTSRRFYTNDQFSFEGDNDKYGDYLLANGTMDPMVTLPRQIVRLRILNCEVERGYEFGFPDDRTFYVISTDGGLVDRPIPVKRMKLMTGERVEILVDLSKDAVGSHLDLMSYNANHPFGFPGGEPGTSRPNGGYLNNIDFRVLRIDVGAATANAITQIPQSLTTNRFWTDAEVTKRRALRITGGRPTFAFDDKPYQAHEVGHVVQLGAVEKWTIENNEIFGHSFHIHDVQFKIVERSSGPVEPYEQGWKDTVYVPRGETVSFVAKFDDFASETDPYMFHCHMSNHEDGGLMGEFLVVADGFRPPSVHPITPELARVASGRAGATATPIVAADSEGRAFDLASTFAKKPVVLVFIEKNCPCSRDAQPYFDRLRAAYGDRVEFVGVIDGDAKAARNWAKRVGTSMRLIADPDLQWITAYQTASSAQTTLVAPGGRIVKQYPGYGAETLRETASKLSTLLGIQPKSIDVSGAPAKAVAGCSFADQSRKTEG